MRSPVPNGLPSLALERDVHVGEGMKVAWFKHPDGNIHNIDEEETA